MKSVAIKVLFGPDFKLKFVQGALKNELHKGDTFKSETSCQSLIHEESFYYLSLLKHDEIFLAKNIGTFLPFIVTIKFQNTNFFTSDL